MSLGREWRAEQEAAGAHAGAQGNPEGSLKPCPYTPDDRAVDHHGPDCVPFRMGTRSLRSPAWMSGTSGRRAGPFPDRLVAQSEIVAVYPYR
jgi:hypothetical protein